MKVIRAEAMGLCFGVRDALEIARAVEEPNEVTIYGELVHNETVLVKLQSRGFRMTAEVDRRHLPETADVLITAHGISETERQRLESVGKRLIDTTCPLVRRVHDAAQALASDGWRVLVIGRRGHVEVEGLVGDLTDFDVLQSADEVRTWPVDRLGIVCQTTTPPRLAQEIHDAVQAKNPHAQIRFVDTICLPTLDRQRAVERLTPLVDAVVVVGGRNSNNTRQLAELCRDRGVPTHQVQSPSDLRSEWFRDCEAVGVTAGTSTLDETIEQVCDALRRLRSPKRRRSGPLSSAAWCRYFRRNAESLLEIPWETAGDLTSAERIAIARSVQVFQKGESGQGRHLLHCAERYAERTGDSDYVEAARLFIQEEQRHAADLGRFLDAAGVARIGRTWTDGIFRWLRHRAGLELTISVLLTAEIIAKVYYAALREATACPALRRLCEQILRDEVAHIRFQCERIALLRKKNPRWSIRLKSALQLVLYIGTCTVVWSTHARAFRAGGFSLHKFCRRAGQEFRHALRIMRGAPSAES